MSGAIILDTETTGLDAPEVIALANTTAFEGPTNLTGAIGLQYFKPSKPISLGALATHHIIDEDLSDAPLAGPLGAAGGCRIPHRPQRRLRLEGYRSATPRADLHSRTVAIALAGSRLAQPGCADLLFPGSDRRPRAAAQSAQRGPGRAPVSVAACRDPTHDSWDDELASGLAGVREGARSNTLHLRQVRPERWQARNVDCGCPPAGCRLHSLVPGRRGLRQRSLPDESAPG